MGLDLWFKEDVGRGLDSVQATMKNSLKVCEFDIDTKVVADIYECGFNDAINSMRIHFGIPVDDGAVDQYILDSAPYGSGL